MVDEDLLGDEHNPARRLETASDVERRRRAVRNLIKLTLARLQAESSRNMYSLHGLDALIRPEAGQVCHVLIVESYCKPGSPHSQALWAILSIISRAW